MKILFEKDKQKHAIIGVLVGLSSFYFPGAWVFIVGCIVAVGKEIYDYYHPLNHTPDVSDALVTIGALSLSEAGISIFTRFF
jgi:hypothetical protein